MKYAALTIAGRHRRAHGTTMMMIKTWGGAVCFITLGIFGIAQGIFAQQRQPPLAKQPASQTANRQTAAKIEPKSRTGSIGGRVITEGGQPLPFAIVNVFALGGRMPRVINTDKDGNFEVAELASGTYEVRPTVAGYVAVRDYAASLGEPSFYRLGDDVTIRMTRGGIISGRVMNAGGEPIVQTGVRVERVRDAQGRTAVWGNRFTRLWETDDRGEYRAYGLEPGQYLVAAGLSNPYRPGPSAFGGDAPTYYPATAREAATLVTVEAGGEAGGIDIRHRGEPGHTVSGKVIGATSAGGTSVNVTLAHWTSGVTEAATYLQANDEGGFALHGVPDGEYNLTASRPNFGSGYGSGVESLASPDARVQVRGDDVGGLVIRLAPLGVVTGRVVFEAKPPAGGTSTPPCESPSSAALEEAVVALRLDHTERSAEEADRPFALVDVIRNSAPKPTGEFTLENLKPGRYRIGVRPPSENWYVRYTGMHKATTSRSPKTDAAAPVNEIVLKWGERVTGLTVAIAEGAAKVSGRVVAEPEAAGNAKAPPRLRVHLVPVEAEHAGNPLRYAEAAVSNSGDSTFVFSHIAPGRYWLLARPAEENRGGDTFVRPAAWDTIVRAKIRREAERANKVVALKSCERIIDYALPHTTPSSPEPIKRTNVQRSGR